MAFDKEYTSIILKRAFEFEVCSDHIDLISDKDNQRISIHRVILKAASKYFTAALGPNFEEGTKNEFILEGTDGRTVKAIVNFCYTGRIDLNEGNVEKFLTIASSVELDLLEEKCRRFYAEKLSITTSVQTLVIADKYSFANLRQQAMDLICGSFEMVPSVAIQELDHRLLRELLKNDKIQATEETVFKRLMDWLQSNEDKRKQHMVDLLKLIRLEHLPTKFLGDTVAVVFETFDCSKHAWAELKKRASDGCLNVDDRRFRPIFCLFLQEKDEEGGVQSSAVKIEKYNNVLNRFEEAAVIELGDREGFNAVLLKNKLFVLGGKTGDIFLKCVSSYDLNSGDESILPEMNTAREGFTTLVLGKYIYVFGGNNGDGTISSCERFNTETKKWKEIKSMNEPRSYASATLMNGYIYVAGGKIGGGLYLSSVELYDPKCHEWTKMKPMNGEQSAFALVELNGFLYAIVTGGEDEVVEKYDPHKVCWTEIESFDNNRDYISSGINVGGQIFVITENGDFGEIKFDDSDQCSFVSLGKSNYLDANVARYLSYRN